MIKILVPGQLQGTCRGASELFLSASSIRGVLMELETRHPVLYGCVCDETGRVRRHVNLFVNDAHCRDRDGVNTTLSPGDIVSILPAVSGG